MINFVITGTLKWINPKGMEVEDNPRAPVYVEPDHRLKNLEIFFINPNKRNSGEYKCQYQQVFNH